LIVNIGHDVVEKPPFIMHRDSTQVVHINFYSAKIDDVYFPQHEVIGDIANALWQIKEKIAPRDHWDFDYFLRIKKHLDTHIHTYDDDARFPIIPQRIVAIVRDTLPDDGILCLDNGMYKIWFARNYTAYGPNTILLDNALATMGAGFPSMLTVKLVYPRRMVVAICGDGGFMMNSQELETAVRLKLHLVVLVVNDNGFGMIQWKQDNMKFERFGLSYGNPDFKKYAESYGARGYKIESADELAPRLEQCLAEGEGVHLIEVPVDYSENVRVLSKELLEKTCNL
ncbi:MAG: acetolactate synthase large subunit, partial [Candidatus Kerfeldbacteria bacterium]|nr:acetolactate synthase large subunit [Candidatus Kerfeldbacteria bacterium]